MTFTQKFDDYVCIGDSITCTIDGYAVTARIAHDETPEAPDQRQDGFWPSLYIDDAGGLLGQAMDFGIALTRPKPSPKPSCPLGKMTSGFIAASFLSLIHI